MSLKNYPSILEIFIKRFKLLLYGDQDGVSLNFLEKSSNGIFKSIEDLVEFEKDIPMESLRYLSKAKYLYSKLIIHQNALTNKNWNAEENLAVLLYILIVTNNYKLVVETGVANGISTNIIMEAIKQSGGDGELHSFDILQKTSKAYSGKLNWNFHLLPTNKTSHKLKKLISQLKKIDLWIHDSNHGYRWQKFEYLLAWDSLKTNGILVSDDVDSSSAWGELAITHFRKSYIIFDSRKFIGIAFK